MEMKKWKRYTIYLIAVLSYIISFEMIYKYIKFKDLLSYATLAYMGIFSFIIGVIFAIEHFIVEIRKSGKWKINLAKIIFCVLPLLFFASFNFIYYSTSLYWIYPSLIFGLFQYFIQDTFIESVAQVLLGYALVTSFYKGAIRPK